MAGPTVACWLKLNESPDYETIQHVLAAWSQYAGLIYFHLLLDRLEEAGHVRSQSGDRPQAGGKSARLRSTRPPP